MKMIPPCLRSAPGPVRETDKSSLKELSAIIDVTEGTVEAQR